MPDRFQEFAYLSYPSPPGSADSPSTSNDASSVVDVNVGFSNWTRDHGLDALYDDVDMLPEWTEEDLEYFSSIPLEDLVLPDAPNVPRAETFFQDFLQSQNVPSHAPSAVPTPRAQPVTPSRLATQLVPTQLPSPPPSQTRQLPPRSPTLNLPPTPLQSGYPQPSPSSSASSVDPHAKPPWPPVPPPGERQRLALPAPGDLSYSACEVIM